MQALVWNDGEGKGRVFPLLDEEDFYRSKLFFSSEEEEVLQKMPRKSSRLQWMSCRLALKELIEEQAFVELKKDSFGRPYLPHLDYLISLSHSNNWAGAFVHPHKKVGFDIEEFRDKILRLEHKFVSPAEAFFLSEDPKTRIQELTLIWSAKESLYKLIGNKAFDFKEHLRLQTSNLLTQSNTEAIVSWKNGEFLDFTVRWMVQESFVITWVLENNPGSITSTFHE